MWGNARRKGKFPFLHLWKNNLDRFFQTHEGTYGRPDRHEQHVRAGVAVPLLQDARRRWQ